MEEQKFCKFCGEKIDKSNIVCPKCGRQLKKVEEKKVKVEEKEEEKEISDPKFYKQIWFMCLILIICPPIGIFLMWKFQKNMKTWLKIVITIVAILYLIIFNIIRSNANDTSIQSDSGNKTPQIQETIEYIKVSKDTLDKALETNAAAAKDTYYKKYVEVTGKLGTIDSDLKYFYLMSATEKWDIDGIYCKIKTNEQKEIVKTLKKDQKITIRGKITDVGEFLGYYIDITEIVTN